MSDTEPTAHPAKTPTLALRTLEAAVDEQNAVILQNVAHTQYRVAIPCPVCAHITEWVEEEGGHSVVLFKVGNTYRMQPCGHKVCGTGPQIVTDDNGYLRVQEAPEA